MKVLEVIEARAWVNKKTGLRVSPYGACPWTSEADRINWTLETTGYTWKNDNGTIGLGRVPAKTREEAIEVMERVNARSR